MLRFFLFNYSATLIKIKPKKLLMLGAMCCQPLVPAIDAEDGRWIITAPLAPLCKPGGHGVIWKLAYDKGIFRWFKDHGRKGATVRQVRLPLLI